MTTLRQEGTLKVLESSAAPLDMATTDTNQTVTGSKTYQSSAGTTAVLVKAAVSQTADLQQWQNSSGTVLTSIDSSGNVRAASVYDGGNRVYSLSNPPPTQPAPSNMVTTDTAQTITGAKTWSATGTFSGVLNAGTVEEGGTRVYSPNNPQPAPANMGTTNTAQTYTAVKTFQSQAAANTPVVVQGASGQTGDIQQWISNTGAVLARIDSAGNVWAGSTQLAGAGGAPTDMATTDTVQTITGQKTISTAAVGTQNLIVKAIASQTADMMQWQDSTGAVKSQVKSDGTIWVNGSQLTSGGVQVNVANTWTATQTFSTSGTTAQNVIVKAVASQTANLVEFQNSAGTLLGSHAPDGGFRVGPTLSTGTAGPHITIGTVTTAPTSAPSGGGVVYVDASGNLQYRNSSGTTQLNSPGMSTTAFHGVSLYCSATPSVPTGTFTPVPFDAETYDTDNYHDTVTNNSRVTIPAGQGGKYLIQGYAEFYANQTGERYVALRKNGSVGIGQGDVASAATGATTGTSISVVADLAASDYVELGVYQNSGGALNIYSGASETRLIVSLINPPATYLGGATATAPTAGTQGFIVKGAASQSANLQEWQNSSGTVLSRINPGGGFYSPNVSLYEASDATFGTVYTQVSVATGKGNVVRGAASQTANLQEWQSSAGTVLASVDSAGRLHGITQRDSHTYAFPGTALSTAAAQPRFFVPMPTGQTVSLAQVVSSVGSGSGTYTIEQWTGSAWAAVTGYSGLALGSSTVSSVALTAYSTGAAGYTALRVNFTAVSAPTDATVSLFLDYTT